MEDPDGIPEETRRCFECKKVAPDTSTPYTLIGAQHGWRVSIERTAEGRRESRWRCPECWEATRKLAKGEG